MQTHINRFECADELCAYTTANALPSGVVLSVHTYRTLYDDASQDINARLDHERYGVFIVGQIPPSQLP